MKTIMKISLAVILAFVTVQFAQAQDQIRKHSGKTIDAKILEIGSVEIKYYKHNTTDNVVYGIDKIDVKEIRYEDGRIEEIKDAFNNEELYATQKRQALKINMFGPLVGHTNISYERSLRPGRSFEVKLGGIGLGKQYGNTSAVGVYTSASYKISTKPNYRMRGMRYAHIMKGAYVRPEIIFGTYSEKSRSGDFIFSETNTRKQQVTYGAIVINLGKQWVIGDRFLIDIYGGLGYGGATSTGGGIAVYHYGLMTTEGLASTGGLKIGMLF